MEKCDEYFEKHCVIEYKKMAEDEEVEVCNEYLERNCDTPGPTVCETVYESECKTTHHLHDVEEDKPNCTVIMVSNKFSVELNSTYKILVCGLTFTYLF